MPGGDELATHGPPVLCDAARLASEIEPENGQRADPAAVDGTWRTWTTPPSPPASSAPTAAASPNETSKPSPNSSTLADELNAAPRHAVNGLRALGYS